MDKLLEFLSFADPNMRYVVVGCALLGAGTSLVGSFTFLRKRALVGDAIAHAILPGICLAFLLVQQKVMVWLLVGAFLSGWIALMLMNWILRVSKLKEDAAIGLILSVFFGTGIFLLTYTQHSGYAEQSGLHLFLFGQAATLVRSDVLLFSVIVLLVFSVLFLFFKEFVVLSFDLTFSRSIGLPIRGLEFLLTALTVIAIVMGIQSVGIVLTAAMLIIPPATARFWTNRMPSFLLLSATTGMLASLVGAYISYVFPSMPTGPWIVLAAAGMAAGSFLLAPHKGVLSRMLQDARIRKKITQENILKAFFHLGEEHKDFQQACTQTALLQKRHYPERVFKRAVRQLMRKKLLEEQAEGWRLSPTGKDQARHIVKLHRLWELYLTRYLDQQADHVHGSADMIEHILTPALEAELEKLMEYPKEDPHHSPIPYR